MSILIKGMKMPKNMRFKAVVDLSEETAYVHTDEMGYGVFETCKAFSVPDHGDLIDRDVVVMRLAEWSKKLIETYGENDEYVNCLSDVLEGLGCDDVIIPAERSEE